MFLKKVFYAHQECIIIVLLWHFTIYIDLIIISAELLIMLHILM